jgi:hypothetical protein
MFSDYGRYFNANNQTLDVIMARFPNEESASTTLGEVMHYARLTGQTGNFAVQGVAAVDYFYASSWSEYDRWVTLMWRHGAWIFAVSSQSQDGLEAAVDVFPY